MVVALALAYQQERHAQGGTPPPEPPPLFRDGAAPG